MLVLEYCLGGLVLELDYCLGGLVLELDYCLDISVACFVLYVWYSLEAVTLLGLEFSQ